MIEVDREVCTNDRRKVYYLETTTRFPQLIGATELHENLPKGQ